jgi:cytochrome P450
LMADFALPFAVRVQCAFLGWPEALHEPLVNWMRKSAKATLAGDHAATSQIAREFEGFIDRLIDARVETGAGPGEDITASLMHERVWGRSLSNEEIASILRNWTVGEVGTIAASVGILVQYLAQCPELQQQLRSRRGDLPVAIDEILRLHGPLVSNRRIARRAATIQGRRIAAGERISLVWMSANRDGRAFEDPDSFRLDRDPARNLLYGAGIHVCPGAPLARMELRIVLEELLEHTADIQPLPEKPPTNAIYPASGFATLPLCIT